MTTHELKCWPEPFSAILGGSKTYELRRADRPFKVGDRLRLMEFVTFVNWDDRGRYTGREVLVEVTYLTPGGAFGLPADLCVMAIRKVETTVTPEEIGPHEMVGDYDCARCGEGMQHYLHTCRVESVR